MLSGIKQMMSQLTATRRPVDFLVCGAQKGGTTSMHAHLCGHPEICMAGVKGVHYFDDERRYSRSALGRSWYHSHFRPRNEHKRMGEVTPIYMYWEPAAERIHRYNPEMRIIVMLRNPILRAYSSWNMQVSKNHEPLAFRDALAMEGARLAEASPLQERKYSYVDRGFYSRQLKRLWALFPREQVLVLKSEEFWRSPRPVLDRVCDFLSVSHFAVVESRRENARAYEAGMSRDEWLHLRAVFEDEIHELESLLGWDCSDWLTPMPHPESE